MKKNQTVNIPLLEEVVVPGQAHLSIEEEDAPLILRGEQAQNLEQQIEKIVEARLKSFLDKAIKVAVEDIKAHLAKELPRMLAERQETDKKS